MWLLSLVLAAQTPIHSRHGPSPSDTVPPYVFFPQPGLDDSAAYQGYATRVYRDTKGNAFQVYLSRRLGRVANVWADALNESVGFTVRDLAGRPAMLEWGSSGAVVTKTDTTRSVAYELETGPAVRIGLFLLGSMRVERDLGYSSRDSFPLDGHILGAGISTTVEQEIQTGRLKGNISLDEMIDYSFINALGRK